MIDYSPASLIAERLVREYGRTNAHRIVDVAIGKFSNVELAALAARWGFWARGKQLAPTSRWRTWGFLTGRGFGKTKSVAEHINAEVEAGRAPLIGLAAQDEDSSVAIQVLGPSGLRATAPPWFKPQWEATAKQLVWPNGARAYVRTPEVPGKIRGLEYHLSWVSELQSWPISTREEALSNFRLSTRLGYARIVWDATPKKGHPLLLDLLADHEADPETHVVVRGTTHENAANLGTGFVAELDRKYGGTHKGREELLGEMLQEAETAVAHQAWIDVARRPMPDRFVRRGIGVDPAITTNRGSDRTGIVEAGLGVDGQGYVLADLSGKHPPHVWAELVLDAYAKNECDVVVVETNRGGALVTQNLRAAAAARGLHVVVIGEQERPHRVRGTVYVKEVHSRGPKLDRAQPLSTAYQAKRVSHVLGASLTTLETTLTTWEPTPGADSPDDLDALNHIMSELLELKADVPDLRAGFRGIAAAAKQLQAPPRGRNIAALLGGLGGGGKI